MFDNSWEFVKYQGAGNDFILIDDRLACFPISQEERIRTFCHRKLGVGADGLILVRRHFSTDFEMRIFNSDGKEAQGCGNGLRCFLRFLHELGFPDKTYSVAMGERIVKIFLDQGRPVVDMGEPNEIKLGLKIETEEFHFVHSGAPHAVFFVPDVDKIDLSILGRKVQSHPFIQPYGTNVNFVSPLSSRNARVRTFERGVGETLSCGTGAVAVAVIGKNLLGWEFPLAFEFSGGVLEVWEEGSHLFLAGPAEKVFSGKIGV